MGRFKDKIKEFTEYTTIHGVGRLSASKGVWQRFLWITCLLGALGILSWQMSRLFRRYLEKPAIVDIRVHVEELDFPAVTICNVNQFRRSQASRDEYLDAAISNFAEALESQLYSGSGDNSSSNDSSSATAPQTVRRKREVAWKSFEETYEAIPAGSSNLGEDGENHIETWYDEGTDDDDYDADEILEVHLRKKRDVTPLHGITAEGPNGMATDDSTIGPDEASTIPPDEASTTAPEDAVTTESHDRTTDSPEVSTTSETTENGTTDSPQAITAQPRPRATPAESNYSPADDYYIPKVNLTGKDWFTAGSDNALVASSENLTRIVAQMDLEARRDYGHQVGDFIQECTYNGKTCSPLNFTGLNHHRYGNCYTFNAGVNDQAILKSSKPGPLYGFTVTLYIEQQEYVEALSPAAGVRVLIHSQDVQPFPEEEGIDVSPGQKTSISLRLSLVDRLRYPYNSNCTDGTGQKIMYNKNYSVAACLRTCSQRHKMDVCKCGDPSLPIVGKTSVCNDPEQLDCIKKIDQYLDVGAVRCHCPQRCRETSYTTTISASDWPGKTFERVLKKQFSRRDAKLREAFKKHTLRENFLKIEVYFKELTYQKLTEVPAYELENLLGDIGGQLGLWVGMSILTLIEVIELVFKLCNIFATKQASVGTQTAKPEKEAVDRPPYIKETAYKRSKLPMKHGVGFDATEYEMRLPRVY